MSRISKDLAEKIATKLTEKSRIKVEKLDLQFRELVTTIYEEQTPDEVKVVFKKYPDWIRTTDGTYLNGHGFNFLWVELTRRCVSNSERRDSEIKMSSKVADQLTKANSVTEKARKEYKLLWQEAHQALLALKTYSNIRKELPEATPYLPPPMSNALVCNFESLKTKLKKQELEAAAAKK